MSISFYSQFLSFSRAISILGLSVLSFIMMQGCSDPTFKVKGEIFGGEGETITIERADFSGQWVAADSAKISGTGMFSISMPAPVAPEIFRLKLGERYLYIPIDSIETITVTSSADKFGTDFTLSGSQNAENLANFEKELISFSTYFNNQDSLEAFKRKVFTEYMQDERGSVVSYYILTKTIDDKPLFDMEKDVRYFAAVATAFKEYRPDDPRTALLERTANEGRRRHNNSKGMQTVLHAEDLSLIDIALPDISGKIRTLSSVVKGKPTLVVFSMMTDPETPALNVKMRKLYDAARCNIYQIGFDSDMAAWREAARNLPWTTVLAGDPESAAKVATDYQVSTLPTFFIVDSDGNLKSRADELDSASAQL